MSGEGGSAGAPGGAAPAAGSAGAPAAPPAPGAKAATKAPKAAEPAAQEWGEKDDAEVFEKLKRAPWAKVKANGEERTIGSREEFLALATDASRARGYNKMVEATKKEAAEAKAIKEEHAQHKALLDRARRGDPKALRELGLVPDEERAAQQKQWEALPPEVQAIVQRNHELEQERHERQQQEEAAKHEAAEKTKSAARTKVMEQARAHAKEVLKDVREELYDVELPEIIGAMRALAEAKQRIGRDYTPEQLAAYVQQRRTAALDSRVGTLKPEAAMRLVLPHLKALIGTPEGLAQLEQVLGADFEGVAGALSGRRLEKWRAAKQKAALSGEVKKPEENKPTTTRGPLPMFRF